MANDLINRHSLVKPSGLTPIRPHRRVWGTACRHTRPRGPGFAVPAWTCGNSSRGAKTLKTSRIGSQPVEAPQLSKRFRDGPLVGGQRDECLEPAKDGGAGGQVRILRGDGLERIDEQRPNVL